MNRSSPCKCKKCNEIFDVADAKQVEKNYYGVKISESRCPKCGGNWVPLDPPEWTDRFLKVNEDQKFYY